MTGFSPKVRAIIEERDGYRCVRCNKSTTQIHHRRPRGMGGTKRPETSSASNGVLLCGSGTTECHGEVENSRVLARAAGYLVSQRQDPSTVPLLIRRTGWVLLNEDGSVSPCRAPL